MGWLTESIDKCISRFASLHLIVTQRVGIMPAGTSKETISNDPTHDGAIVHYNLSRLGESLGALFFFKSDFSETSLHGQSFLWCSFWFALPWPDSVDPRRCIRSKISKRIHCIFLIVLCSTRIPRSYQTLETFSARSVSYSCTNVQNYPSFHLVKIREIQGFLDDS
jgi:hypothetical protein